MSTLLTACVALSGLLIVLRLAIACRLSGFSAERARLRSGSLHGSNATLMISAAALGGLGISASSNAERWPSVSEHLAPLLASAVVVGVISLIAFRSADALFAVLGLGAQVVGAGLEHGPAGAVGVLVLTMLVLVVLSIVRGFVRPG